MPELPQVAALQTGATAAGNGATATAFGYGSAVIVEVVETAGGTATLTLQGSFDGQPAGNWYSVGYQQTDGVATPARTAAAISVTANLKHVYQVLDPYPYYRAVLSAVVAANVTARAYLAP